mmetsp:Transcript_64836/g.180485  ORF Transcript_64836/g.180485 Transcript_64836/m.180485 type:complete len:213 (+) Transcript_64836:1040-1678(+)
MFGGMRLLRARWGGNTQRVAKLSNQHLHRAGKARIALRADSHSWRPGKGRISTAPPDASNSVSFLCSPDGPVDRRNHNQHHDRREHTSNNCSADRAYADLGPKLSPLTSLSNTYRSDVVSCNPHQGRRCNTQTHAALLLKPPVTRNSLRACGHVLEGGFSRTCVVNRGHLESSSQGRTRPMQPCARRTRASCNKIRRNVHAGWSTGIARLPP